MSQGMQPDMKRAWISPREPQARPRLVIAGTGSGSGKTTVTLGLMCAFARRGLKVQGFKCGPDYIDPAYHTAVTGSPSRNLDSWMTSSAYLQEYFLQASAQADLSVIEGVMGLYDGKEDTALTGSTAEIAILTASPVLLVVDVRSMGRSAAAIVLGFRQLEPQVRIAAVLVNRCGSEGHYRLVKAAIEAACGIPVVGWLPATAGWTSRSGIWACCPPWSAGSLRPCLTVLPTCWSKARIWSGCWSLLLPLLLCLPASRRRTSKFAQFHMMLNFVNPLRR